MSIPKIGYLESFLLQIVLYSLVWLIDEYVGSLLCIVIPIIAFSILIVSIIVELIEKSNIPRSYFVYMLIFILSPIVVGISFNFLYGGQLDWMQ